MKASGRFALDVIRVLIPTALVLAFIGCSGTVPMITPDGPDRGQADIGPPPLSARPSYETARATIDVPVPLTAFSHWFDQSIARDPGAFLKGTATVPGVVRSESLTGDWQHSGDRRKLIFTDGSSVLEQLLDKGPQKRRVEMWDLKNQTGRYLVYALEEFTLFETPTGTRVVWVTQFEPKVQPPDGWMIRSYVGTDYRDFMQTGLRAMAVQATAEAAALKTLK